MKQFLSIIFLLLINLVSHSQMFDAQWVLGYGRLSVVAFKNDSVGLDSIVRFVPMYLTSASICDENGNLRYICNGDIVADSHGDTLANGANLSPCAYTTQSQNGFDLQQAAMFLPMPGSSRYYYLFHFAGDTAQNTRPGTLYYSVIDREGNGRMGEIVSKNVTYYKGIFRGGGMTACKHANGRDWWIVMGGRGSNTYYTFLLTPSGITDTITQNIGTAYHGPFDNAYSCFSPDGRKYATGCYEGLITVLDFDRCSGMFSSPVTISNIPAGYTVSGCGSMAFSPNGRFVYVTDRIDLTQYDLWATNIQDSVEVYLANDTDNAQISYIELAPNGKLYGSTWNGGYHFLHVVNYPDSLGKNCNFVWGGQPTFSDNSTNLPNMPNYRLGALIGSGCDTIRTGTLSITASNPLRILPNPADKYVYIEMGMQGNYEFELLNVAGQLVYKKETRQVDVFDTEKLPAGTYFVHVISQETNTEIASKKVVVAH